MSDEIGINPKFDKTLDTEDSTQVSLKSDFLDRFIFDKKDVRACFVNLKQTLKNNHQHQSYPPFVEHLLNEFMLGAILLSANLKFEGRLVLQLRSDSAISLLMAECDDQGRVRAYAQHDELHDQFNFSDLLGSTLAMTIDAKVGKPYQGIVPLSGENLGQCLEYYFEQSEQLSSHFYLVSQGKHAAGFMLQQLPAQLEKDNETRKLDWQELKALGDTLTSEEALSLDGKTIMHRLYHDHDLRSLGQAPLSFSCSCSKVRMDKALISIGREELESIILEQGQIDMSCELCRTAYVYGSLDVQALFSVEPTDQVLH